MVIIERSSKSDNLFQLLEKATTMGHWLFDNFFGLASSQNRRKNSQITHTKSKFHLKAFNNVVMNLLVDFPQNEREQQQKHHEWKKSEIIFDIVSINFNGIEIVHWIEREWIASVCRWIVFYWDAMGTCNMKPMQHNCD